MLNFYYQVGYSGLCLLLIGLVGLFMAIRGTVLVILVKKQGLLPQGILNQIIITVQQCEHATAASTATTPANRDTANSDVATIDTENSGTARDAATQGSFTNLTTPSSAPSRELIINTLMQVRMKGIYSSMYFLKLCAAIGPLLGLLGTVLGMVDVFSNLSARSMPDPSMLAGGIWEALLTTVMGLTLAIPALIVHYYLLMSLRGIRNQINLAVSNIKLN